MEDNLSDISVCAAEDEAISSLSQAFTSALKNTLGRTVTDGCQHLSAKANIPIIQEGAFL